MTLISTFYSFKPLVTAAHAYSPSKIVLIVAKDSLQNQKVQEDVNKVKELYGKVAEIKVSQVDGSDLLAIAKETVKLLEKDESRKIVNVSGGWKVLAQGVLYGCYVRPDLVEKIVCNDIGRENAMVEMPKLSFGITSAKRELLEEISKRNGRSIAEIAKKMKKTRGMIYQHLKELREMGYVNEKFEITLAGRLALV
ncbi:MAG: CRISPR-associated CARF protein Csa3 [Candidatus Micrarchaeota archaeon]